MGYGYGVCKGPSGKTIFLEMKTFLQRKQENKQPVLCKFCLLFMIHYLQHSLYVCKPHKQP